MRLNRNGTPLDGAQIEGFRQALRDAFFRRESFEEFLLIQLNKRFGDLASEGDYRQQLLNIVDKADEEDWSAELLEGACLWRPLNIALAIFAQQFGLLPTPSAKNVFESKIFPHHPDLDVGPWCSSLLGLMPKICRIDFPLGISSKLGTGFLLGKNIVMTSFHVMEEILKGKVDSAKVSLHFDYRVLEDGRTLHKGVIYHLAKGQWWRDFSEYSPLDGQVNPSSNLPEIDHLDYILLLVEGNPGLEPIGGSANKQPQPQKRGWIDLPPPSLEPVPGMELFVLHHPDGKRLKITLNTASVDSVNGNRTRLYHQTNTAWGTSGAPCFNFNWELIALHQTGDPAADKNHPAEINQSIPFTAIRKRLERRDMLRYLGDGSQIGKGDSSPPSSLEADVLNGSSSPSGTPQKPFLPADKQTRDDRKNEQELFLPVEEQVSANHKPMENTYGPEPSFLSIGSVMPEDHHETVDRNVLSERLSTCPSPIFERVVFLLELPHGIVSPENMSQSIRAIELIKWAEHPDGPGIENLYNCYKQVIKKKR